MKEKGFALPLVLVIIVLGVIVIGISYLQLRSKQQQVKQLPVETEANQQTSDKNTENWKIYSNGWYNYTFKYPADKEIRYNGRSGGLGLMDTVISIWPECTLVVNFGSKPTVRTQGEKAQEIVKDGQKWEEYYLIEQKGNFLYERQASARLTQKDGLNYVFASMGSEKGKFSSLCEDIFSTFKFGIDENIQSAKESKQVKEAAIVYAKEKLPEYNFAGGVFKFLPSLPREPLSPKNEELFMSSNKALVDFIKNDIRSLELGKNGDWKVTKEIFRGQRTGSETSTILWEDSTAIF